MKVQQLIYFIVVLFGLTMANENALRVAKGNVAFSKDLYSILAEQEGNVFFSPLSIHAILSLLSQGSQEETLAQLNHVLNVSHEEARDGYKSVMTSLNNVPDVQLHIANKVFVKDSYKIKDAFQKVAVENYLAEVEGVDFNKAEAAAQNINSWVEQKTNNKIHDLIAKDDIDALTRMILVNAIYFKGDWAHKFQKDSTRKEKFYTSETESVDVDMMSQTNKFRYGEIKELDAKVVELPYKNKDVSMLVILPNKRDGIKDLEAKLKNFDLSTVGQQMYTTEVNLWLPRFKVETTIPLNEPLKKMGLERIFTNAKLNGLLESKEPLEVSKVVQKAFIEVNEEGAEAAAATGMVLMTRCMMVPRTGEFKADHPFVLQILSKSGGEKHELFVGKVTSL